MSTRQIRELWQGDIFTYGGTSWVVLNQEEKGGRVLSKDIFTMKPFDEGESKDWRAASLKEYMTGDLLKQLTDAGADANKIIENAVDLKAVNGSTDYGTDPCKLAPMTETQYTAFRKAIPTVGEVYWLVTPYSHEEPYIGGAYMHHVRIIRPDGSIDGSAPDGGVYGVRAAMVLAPDTEVDLTASELDEQIAAILAYDNPVITIDGVQELAAGLKTMIQKAAAECEHIPAVQDQKTAEASTYQSYTAVTMYQALRSAQVTGTIARTDMTVLADKL